MSSPPSEHGSIQDEETESTTHRRGFSGDFRRTITKAVNKTAVYRCFADELEKALDDGIANCRLLEKEAEKREIAQRTLHSLDSTLTVIRSTMNKWETAISTLPTSEQGVESTFRLSYLARKFGVDASVDDDMTPTEVFFSDGEHYLRVLRTFCGEPSSLVPSAGVSHSSSLNAIGHQAPLGAVHSAGFAPTVDSSPPVAVASMTSETQLSHFPAPPPGLPPVAPIPSPFDARSAHTAFVSATLRGGATSDLRHSSSAHGQLSQSVSSRPPLSGIPPHGVISSDEHNKRDGRDERGDKAMETPLIHHPRHEDSRDQQVGAAVHHAGSAPITHENLARPPPICPVAPPPPHPSFPMVFPTMQLPSMPLPSFDGREPWSFPTFLQTFEAVVLANPSLTDLQRLHYLRSCLKDEALDSVASIVAREGCYASAVDRLRKIYKGGSQEVSALIRQRIQMIEILSEDCGVANELRSIREALTLVSQLLSHDVDNAYLTDLIVSRFPERVVKKAIKIRLEDRSIGTLPLLEKLETALIKDMTIEKLTQISKKKQGIKKDNVCVASENGTLDNGEEEIEEPSRTLSSSPPIPGPAPTIKNTGDRCVLCSSKHSSGQEERCPMFPSPAERIARARTLRLCFRCLSGAANHNFRLCEARCALCNGRHHRALCKMASNTKAREGVQLCMNGDNEKMNDADWDEYYKELDALRDGETTMAFGEIIGVATATDVPHIPRIPSAKLITFQALLVNPNDGRTHPVNIMLDHGASVGLISDRVVRILQMKCIGSAETAFCGVGGKGSEFQEYKIHRFTIKSTVKDSVPLHMEAYEFPSPLAAPERRFEISAKDLQFAKRERLESAILNDPDGSPDIIVGLRESAEITNTGRKFIKLPSGMILLPTTFGYVRAGFPTSRSDDSTHYLKNRSDRINALTQIPWNQSSGMESMSLPQRKDSYAFDCTGTSESIRWKLPLSWLTMLFCLLTMLCPFGSAANLKQDDVQCLPYGAIVNFTSGYGVQICTTASCQNIRPEDNSGSVRALFAPSISAAPFRIFVKIVTSDDVFIAKRLCPASDVCENMKEDWSLDHFIHPECHTIYTMFLFFSFLYVMIMTPILSICMIYYRQTPGSLRILWRAPYLLLELIALFILRMCMAVVALARRRLRAPARAQGDGRRERSERLLRRAAFYGLAITMLLSIPPQSLAGTCHHAVITTENVERCQGGNCDIERGYEITLDSISRTACIKLTKEGDEKIEGAITIEAMENQLVCTRHPHGIHRDAEVHVASSKRCFFMGSCDGQKCENMEGDHQIEEFDHLSNWPGHTHCIESCGGIECGCLSAHPGCLFYRTYLMPTSSKVYESLRCSSWSSRVILRVNTTTGATSTSTSVEMTEGEFTSKMMKEGIRLLRIDEIEKPNAPDVLHETFVTDGLRMTAARNFDANNYCGDVVAAQDFKCTPKERCTCQPVVNKVNCECEKSTIEELFKTDATLPIHLVGMEIEHDKKTLTPLVKLRSGSIKLYLVLTEEIKESMIKEENPECKIDVAQAHGCHSCEEGADISFKCTSSQSTDVLISCDDNAISIPCDEKNIESTRKMHFGKSEVSTSCQTSCGQEITVEGRLSTPPHLAPSNTVLSAKGGSVPHWDLIPEIAPLIDMLFRHWKEAVIGTILIAGAILISIVACVGGPTAFLMFLPSRLRRRDHLKTV